MSGIAGNRETSLQRLDVLYEPIADELARVEQILRREMRSKYPYVDDLVRYGCLLGGKRLRPALLLLTAKSLGKVTDEHLILAAVVEMIHTATLVHDDVLDDAHVRRHVATVNARWDNEASVLLGDFLFSHAFYLASTTGSTFACQTIGRSTNIVCEGEIRQKGSCADFSLTEVEYYRILEAKTAELCACSCQLGAHFAGASAQQVECLTRYGRLLGIAFQIADDLLDLVGDEAAAGKSLGTDLAQQKPTLPVIRAIAIADAAQRERLLALLRDNSNGHAGVLQQTLNESAAFDYARDKGRQFAREAHEQLASLPSNPARQSLANLAEFVVNRAH